MNASPPRWRDQPASDPELARVTAWLDDLDPTAPPSGAQARVWRRLETPPAPRHLGVAFIAAGSVAAAVVVAALVISQPPAKSPSVTIVAHAGAVSVGSRAIDKTVPLPNATPITTGDDSRLDLAWADQQLNVSARTEIQLVDGETPRVELIRGQLRAVAAPDAAPLVLISNRWRIRVQDAEIQLTRWTPHRVVVRSIRGTADIDGPNGRQSLLSGQRRTLGPPEPEAAPETPKPILPKPTTDAPKAASPRKSIAHSETPSDAPKALYRQAQLESEPDRAMALFDRVAATDNSWAEMAGHQAARLAMKQARWHDAIRRLEAVGRRYPDGPYEPERRLNLIECRIRIQAFDQVDRDLKNFLSNYPNSPRVEELVRLRQAREQPNLEIQPSSEKK